MLVDVTEIAVPTFADANVPDKFRTTLSGDTTPDNVPVIVAVVVPS